MHVNLIIELNLWCMTFHRLLYWKGEQPQTDQWTHCCILSYKQHSVCSLVSPCVWLPCFQCQGGIWWHIWVWTAECSVCIWCCSGWWMEIFHLLKKIVVDSWIAFSNFSFYFVSIQVNASQITTSKNQNVITNNNVVVTQIDIF